jgi:hypothetical protein
MIPSFRLAWRNPAHRVKRLSKEPLALEVWQTEEEARAYRVERKRLSENHFNRAHTLAAWLLATLVAVNGGAGITLLSRIEAIGPAARAPSLAFVIGVSLAIVSGFASWWEAQDRSLLYYLESLRDDQLSAEGTKRKSFLPARVGLLRKTARGTNYASLLCFFIGCALAKFMTYNVSP